MRTLLTLIKRQIADNALCFVVAGLISMALVFGVATAVFTEDHIRLSDYTRKLLIGAPFLVAVGCCVLGIVQARIDTAGGIATVLTVLPVRRVQILVAQIVTGVCVIMTVMVPLGVTAVFFWKLYGPPEWLFRPWIADSFIGLTLAAVACYLLGLQAGRRANRIISTLLSLPPSMVVLLLVAARGFGSPLLAVLVPLIMTQLFLCRESSGPSRIASTCTGLVILICLAIPFFWGRYLCDGLLVANIEASVRISPSGLLPFEIENDPNVRSPSRILGGVAMPRPRVNCLVCNLSPFSMDYDGSQTRHYLLENAPIIEYFVSRRRGERNSYSTRFHERRSPIYVVHLDEVGDQLVYRRTLTDTPSDRFTWQWTDTVEVYAGPKGVSGDPNTVGRFSSPTVYIDPGSSDSWHTILRPFIVYDRGTKRFHAVDFENQIISRGPRITHTSMEPATAGLLSQSGVFSTTEFDFPSSANSWSRYFVDTLRGSVYLPIVGASGQIHLLDRRTLTLGRPAGRLPRPRTLFGWASSKPKDLLGYDVDVISPMSSSYSPVSTDMKTELIGVMATSVSRQGMWASVSVFDKDGNEIKSATSQTGFFDKPRGPVLTLTKYVLESLHPPVLTVASFFTAYSFEARASHRALFLMPNSFAAMVKDRDGNIVVTLGILLLVMLPSLALAGWLGYRVARDAATIGLSLGARRIWLAATILFGLAGYITYRLSRPKVTLVTCANCGKGRRPDTETCHHCGQGWDIPELTPPWRVISTPAG